MGVYGVECVCGFYVSEGVLRLHESKWLSFMCLWMCGVGGCINLWALCYLELCVVE